MDIRLTRDEAKELLQLVCIGAHIRNAVFDREGVFDPEEDMALVHELCVLAQEEGLEDVEEDFEGAVGFTPLFQLMCYAIIDQYEEEYFWRELENRAGARDLRREEVEC